MSHPRLALSLAAALLAAATGPPPAAGAEPTRVVIPFDFESKFDGGRYGQIIGDLLWTRIKKQGGFVLPETMQDVRDWYRRTGTLPNPETPLDAMRAIVVKEQAGDLAIWGKVERVPGTAADAYDFWIKVADFSTDPARVLYSRRATTATVSEIPHTYVKAALDALYGRSPTAPAPPDPRLDRRWAVAPNLVRGDFESLTRGGPPDWDPPTPHVSRVVDRGNGYGSPATPGKPNHVLRFTLDEEVAGGTGVLYYSDFFPVEENATYRFQCRWRTSGSAVKVFVKCYDEMPTPDRARADAQGRAAPASQKREVYRSQQNPQGPRNAWNVHTEDFTPKHTLFTPRWGRVMLYAYWPAGVVEWDDVVVKQIAPPAADRPKKVRRPSLETKVRSDEIK